MRPRAVRESLTSGATDKPTVLIIDDDVELLGELATFLEASGLRALAASDGVTGLRMLAEEEDVAVVVLDVLMPLLDGMAVLQTIKKRGVPTRVIVLTAYATEVSDVVDFVKTGACDYLIKPASPADVLGAVLRAIELDTPVTPVIAELASRAERLYSEVRDLKRRYGRLRTQYEQLRRSRAWSGVAVKAASLAISLLVAGIIYIARWVTDGRALAAFTGVLFVLLLIPLHRARFLSARYRELEVSTRMGRRESDD